MSTAAISTPLSAVSATEASTFPSLEPYAGARLDPKLHVEPGTSSAVLIANIVAVVAGLGISIVTYGVALIAALVAALIHVFFSRRVMARIRGSGIEVSERQFPAIHACVRSYADRLGLAKIPAVYIIQDHTLNAMSMRVGRRRVVLLLDSIVEGCLRSGDPRSLNFIIGHELAHHALGHTAPWRGHVRTVFKKLSRLDEFSCDAVARDLVGDIPAAVTGLSLLTVGPGLVRFLNAEQLRHQALMVQSDPLSVKAEKKLTHPLLMRRLARCFGA